MKQLIKRFALFLLDYCGLEARLYNKSLPVIDIPIIKSIPSVRKSADYKYYDIYLIKDNQIKDNQIIGEHVYNSKYYEQSYFTPSKYGKSLGLKQMAVNMNLTQLKDLLK